MRKIITIAALLGLVGCGPSIPCPDGSQRGSDGSCPPPPIASTPRKPA